MAKNNLIRVSNWISSDHRFENPSTRIYTIGFLFNLIVNVNDWRETMLRDEGGIYDATDVLLSIASYMDINSLVYESYDDLYEALLIEGYKQ